MSYFDATFCGDVGSVGPTILRVRVGKANRNGLPYADHGILEAKERVSIIKSHFTVRTDGNNAFPVVIHHVAADDGPLVAGKQERGSGTFCPSYILKYQIPSVSARERSHWIKEDLTNIPSVNHVYSMISHVASSLTHSRMASPS